MASFGPDSPILLFRLPWAKWIAGPRWLLWPAWAWRVVAPRPRPRPMNILQRAALGLCVAGVERAEDIGAKLFIATDLAALIITELEGLGWLDFRHRPTQKGREALAGADAEVALDPTIGWVFSDPFTGETWPRFHAGELPFKELTVSRGRCWTVETGTVGDPRPVTILTVSPGHDGELRRTMPGPGEVLRAVHAHRRQWSWEDEPIAFDAPAMKRVSFVSEAPLPCWLASRAWLAAPGDWRADDPFGFGDSPRLRRWIDERFEHDAELRAWLTPIAGGDPDASDVPSLVQAAEWRVDAHVGGVARARPPLFQRLTIAQRALLEAELPDSPEDKWDDVLVKAQRAVEWIFRELGDGQAVHTPFSKDSVFVDELLTELARRIGFETPLPESLARVRRGKIESAARSGSGSLRPLVCKVLLGTADPASSPLVAAARVEPRLLHRLDALAGARDRAAHEGPAHARQTLEQRRRAAREAIETMFTTAKLLLTD